MLNFDSLIKRTINLKESLQTGRKFHVAWAVIGGSKPIAFFPNDYTKCNKESYFYKGLSINTFNRNKGYFPTLHAENGLLAKMKYLDDVSNISIISIRINNRGELATSKPCENCSYLLGRRRFKNVFFVDENLNWRKF
jgi:deoxycytidylate deaminase